MPEEELLARFLSLHPRIRKRFPQVDRDDTRRSRIHINAAAGTLVVDTAAQALGQAARMNSLPGEAYPAEIATREFHWRVRSTVTEFINGWDPAEITFHFSTTNALFNLAFALGKKLSPQNNIVVTNLDHMANITPWEVIEGAWRGCEVRRARLTPSADLDTDHLLSLVDERTAVVAVTLASNGLGTIVPVREISAAVKAKCPTCFVCVDGVHHALHGSIDVRALGCDFLAFSGYKVFGPMLGVLWGKRELLEGLTPYRVETNKDEIPFKFEQGTLSNPALAGLEASLEYLLWLAGELDASLAPSDRRQKFRAAMTAIAAYEQEVTGRILLGFQRLGAQALFCFGVSDPAGRGGRDPTFAFELAGRSAAQVKKYLWEESGIQIADGNHYSAVFYRHFKMPSVCRASFAHYNSLEEASAFLEALTGFTSS